MDDSEQRSLSPSISAIDDDGPGSPMILSNHNRRVDVEDDEEDGSISPTLSVRDTPDRELNHSRSTANESPSAISAPSNSPSRTTHVIPSDRPLNVSSSHSPTPVSTDPTSHHGNTSGNSSTSPGPPNPSDAVQQSSVRPPVSLAGVPFGSHMFSSFAER